MNGTERELHAHLQVEHAADLAPIAEHMLRGTAPDAFLSIYNQAIAVKCRSQAPFAGPSLDRKALKSFSESCQGHRVEALVCFVCACTYTYVEEVAAEGRGDIEWARPLEPDFDAEELLFLDRPIDETGDLLSLKVFLERYDKVSDAGHRLQDHESFSDWCLTWPSNVLPTGRQILCCPEDRLGVLVQGEWACFFLGVSDCLRGWQKGRAPEAIQHGSGRARKGIRPKPKPTSC